MLIICALILLILGFLSPIWLSDPCDIPVWGTILISLSVLFLLTELLLNHIDSAGDHRFFHFITILLFVSSYVLMVFGHCLLFFFLGFDLGVSTSFLLLHLNGISLPEWLSELVITLLLTFFMPLLFLLLILCFHFPRPRLPHFHFHFSSKFISWFKSLVGKLGNLGNRREYLSDSV